jgi:CubicO group peptidase (beta-lactamase class C family)
MKRLISFILIASLLVLAVPAAAQDTPTTDFETAAIDDAIASAMEAQRAPGLAIAIVYQGQVVYAAGYGVRDTETNAPITPDTLFMFGSTLKPLTTIGLLRLVEQGLVDLDAPVSTYLPELPIGDAITARQLLSHTAGLADEANADGPQNPEALRESMAQFTEAAMFAPAGTAHSYSNPGYDIAGTVIEAASGQYYDDYMASQVFAPMGMERTTFDPNVAITYPVAAGYQPGMLGISAVRRNSSHTTEAPSGLAYSSVNDLTRLLEFILEGGVVGGEPVLSAELAQAMATPAQVRIASPMRYGLGLFVEQYRGTTRIGHGGNVDGYSALMETLPAHDLGVVVLANVSAFDASPIFDAVVDTLLNLPATSEESAPYTPDNLADYVGEYVVRDLAGEPAFTGRVSLEGERLQVQISGQPTLELRATAPDTFEVYFGEMASGQLVTFLRDETGTVGYLFLGNRVACRALQQQSCGSDPTLPAR